MGKKHHSKATNTSEKHSIGEEPNSDTSSQTSSPGMGYLKQLKIWHGSFSNVDLVRLFLRPLPFLLSPVVSFWMAPLPCFPCLCVNDPRSSGSYFWHMACKLCGLVCDQFKGPIARSPNKDHRSDAYLLFHNLHDRIQLHCFPDCESIAVQRDLFLLSCHSWAGSYKSRRTCWNRIGYSDIRTPDRLGNRMASET